MTVGVLLQPPTFLSGVKVELNLGTPISTAPFPKTAVARWSGYRARFVSQLLTRDIRVRWSKSQSWLHLWPFPFFCIFSPFLFTSIIRGHSYSCLTKVTFGFISLLCCSLLFDYLVLVLCLINFFLLKNYYYLGPKAWGILAPGLEIEPGSCE